MMKETNKNSDKNQSKEELDKLIQDAQSYFENPEPISEEENNDLFSNFRNPDDYKKENLVNLSFTTITLYVANLVNSKEFYEKIGWQQMKGNDQSSLKFKLNPIFLELREDNELNKDKLSQSDASDSSAVKLSFLCKNEDEVNMLYQCYSSEGIPIVKTPYHSQGGKYCFFFSDLDGYIFEIYYQSNVVY